MVRSAPFHWTEVRQPPRGASPQRLSPAGVATGVGVAVAPGAGVVVAVEVATGVGVAVAAPLVGVGVAVGSTIGFTTIATAPGASALLAPSFTWNVKESGPLVPAVGV